MKIKTKNKNKVILSNLAISFFLIFLLISSCNATGSSENEQTNNANKKNQPEVNTEKPATSVEMLNGEAFRKKVFDYKTEKSWKYLGNKPCVIDFYADWCAPCRKVAPIMEELAKLYEGKVLFYKINVDFEKELANAFGIFSIPAILYCPVNEQPQMTFGLYPKEEYIKIIDEFLLKSPKK